MYERLRATLDVTLLNKNWCDNCPSVTKKSSDYIFCFTLEEQIKLDTSTQQYLRLPDCPLKPSGNPEKCNTCKHNYTACYSDACVTCIHIIDRTDNHEVKE